MTTPWTLRTRSLAQALSFLSTLSLTRCSSPQSRMLNHAQPDSSDTQGLASPTISPGPQGRGSDANSSDSGGGQGVSAARHTGFPRPIRVTETDSLLRLRSKLPQKKILLVPNSTTYMHLASVSSSLGLLQIYLPLRRLKGWLLPMCCVRYRRRRFADSRPNRPWRPPTMTIFASSGCLQTARPYTRSLFTKVF